MKSPSKIEADNKEVSFWSQSGWIPWQNQFTRRNFTASSESSKLPWQTQFFQIKKTLQLYLGFVNCYKIYISTMAENLKAFNKLFKGETPIKIKSEIKDTFDSVNNTLRDACGLALKQHIAKNQIVFMTNASSRSAGYNLMIEDNPGKKIQSQRKTYASVAFGRKTYSPAQLKCFIYWKQFQAILEFAHVLWETTRPIIVFADNK